MRGQRCVGGGVHALARKGPPQESPLATDRRLWTTVRSVALVTVIMPSFNAARTIRRAIESVRNQPFQDWNLVVVDDGSTDGTGEVAREAGAGDSRVEVLVNPVNAGAAASMNCAWRRTDSRYVAVVDADDAVLPSRLSAPVRVLDTQPSLSVVGGAAHFVDADNRYMRTVLLPSSHEELSRRRWYLCPFVHPSVTMRRTFLDLTGGYTDGLRLGEDYDLWMRGFFAGTPRYANLSEPLVIYTAKRVQRWKMIGASARVRCIAGRREGRRLRGTLAATRILLEGAVERTGIFALRDRLKRTAPASLLEGAPRR
jgi:glycosyltransferase involved in cell wall biosynthesis